MLKVNIETPHLSCSAKAHPNVTDSCCTETYGGLVLATQLWNTYTGFESQGQVLPKNTWSIHGLWPDFCNGSYTQYCDLRLERAMELQVKSYVDQKTADNMIQRHHRIQQQGSQMEHLSLPIKAHLSALSWHHSESSTYSPI